MEVPDSEAAEDSDFSVQALEVLDGLVQAGLLRCTP